MKKEKFCPSTFSCGFKAYIRMTSFDDLSLFWIKIIDRKPNNFTICCVNSFSILWSIIFNTKLLLPKCKGESDNSYDFRVLSNDGFKKSISREPNSKKYFVGFWFVIRFQALRVRNCKKKNFVHPRFPAVSKLTSGWHHLMIYRLSE